MSHLDFHSRSFFRKIERQVWFSTAYFQQINYFTDSGKKTFCWTTSTEAHTPSFLLSSMSANKPILMTCHSRPRTRCCLPSFRSSAPMFTTWQPIADAEFRARFKFSCWTKQWQVQTFRDVHHQRDEKRDPCVTWMVKGVSFFLLMVLSSMVSGTDRLIILLTKTNQIQAEKHSSHTFTV